MVIKPIFVNNDRLQVQEETKIPPKELFYPLGYNKEPNDGNKIYRRYLEGPLEEDAEYM